MPGRATVFIRCAPGCIDSKFARTVMSIYKSAERVPVDPAVPIDVIETVCTALRCDEGKSIAHHVDGERVGGGSKGHAVTSRLHNWLAVATH